MTKASKAEEFLLNMTQEPAEPPPRVAVPTRAAKKAAVKIATTRTGLKHIGGYFGLDTVEKVAVLRARLNLDNSELIELAINELHGKQTAKRAFGDA